MIFQLVEKSPQAGCEGYNVFIASTFDDVEKWAEIESEKWMPSGYPKLKVDFSQINEVILDGEVWHWGEFRVGSEIYWLTTINGMGFNNDIG